MPIKFDKKTSTHLFKYISRIDIKCNPFDGRAVSVRELQRQVEADRFRNANPRLEIKAEYHNRPDPPFANFTLVDGKEQLVDEPHLQTAHEILFDIHLRLAEMDALWKMDGKNIDDA